MLKEFKAFATRGNIIDLAVGVVIGGAFQSIINSLVNDMIMPFVSILTNKVDFSNMVFTVGEASIKYGNFITAVVNFLIIAFSIFLVVTYFNKFNQKMEKMKQGQVDKLNSKFEKKNKKKKEEAVVAPTVKICPYCYSEIHINATRCPHCTSKLAQEDPNKLEKEVTQTESE